MGSFQHKAPKKFGNRRDSDRNDSRRTDRNPGKFDRNVGRNAGKLGRKSYSRPERSTVTCDSCKKRCEVPFVPSSNKPIYCSDCFRKDTPSSKPTDTEKDFVEINKKLDKIMKALKVH
jgi:CxxC-x17-CxxC domain-containing protein